MMSENIRPTAGFTLIETLVYLALLGLVFTGLMSSAFAMVESIDRVKMKAVVQEEANFLLAKINWAITGATAASVPGPQQLVLARTNSIPTVATLDVNDGYLRINGMPLNNSSIRVDVLSFNSTTTDPVIVSVSANFTLKAKTPTGRDYLQDFALTNYLRK